LQIILVAGQYIVGTGCRGVVELSDKLTGNQLMLFLTKYLPVDDISLKKTK
jgi:hypothetical protein